jgi:hypothetical protein
MLTIQHRVSIANDWLLLSWDPDAVDPESGSARHDHSTVEIWKAISRRAQTDRRPDDLSTHTLQAGFVRLTDEPKQGSEAVQTLLSNRLNSCLVGF